MTDPELVRLLMDAEAGRDAALRAWLAATDLDAARQALYDIGSNAALTQQLRTNLWLLPTLMLSLGSISVVAWISGNFTIGIVTLLAVLGQFYWFLIVIQQWQYRDARYALLVLAEQGDARVLPLLASEWQANPAPEGKAWNDQVTTLLTRLLDAEGTISPQYQAITQLRVIGTILLLGSRADRLQDLSVADTYLAIAIVRFLHQVKDTGATAFVQQVADLPQYHRRLPNRTLVSEVADTLLHTGRAGNASPLVAAPSVSVPTTSAPLLAQNNHVP